MTTYQRRLRGMIKMFAKGCFIRGLTSPTLPSDIEAVEVYAMSQQRGRIQTTFSLKMKSGAVTLTYAVSFSAQNYHDFYICGVYSHGGDLFGVPSTEIIQHSDRMVRL